jgi:hypothetical protein
MKSVLRGLRAAALLSLGLTPPLGSLAAQQEARSPSQVLGIEVGADSVLADWTQIGRYMTELAQASDYVRLDTIGQSTLGKPILMVTLTAPRHQARLEEVRRTQELLADPRLLTTELEDSLTRHQPAVVFINNNIHSTEVGSSQFSMILAHRLATEDRYRKLLDHMVVLMTPSANPDGLDTVVAWYRGHKGTPYEGGPMPWLYHPYVGHDNNRDWFMLTQVETQVISRVLYQEWFPEVVWDVHQMGNRGARMFVPDVRCRPDRHPAPEPLRPVVARRHAHGAGPPQHDRHPVRGCERAAGLADLPGTARSAPRHPGGELPAPLGGRLVAPGRHHRVRAAGRRRPAASGGRAAGAVRAPLREAGAPRRCAG